MEIEGLLAIASGLKYIGIGLAMLPIGWVGMGIAKIYSTLISETSRNPGARPFLFTYALIGFALTEAAALYVLVVAFIMLFS